MGYLTGELSGVMTNNKILPRFYSKTEIAKSRYLRFIHGDGKMSKQIQKSNNKLQNTLGFVI